VSPLITVGLSLGSNQNADHYIVKALDALQLRFGELLISPVYESVAVGCIGRNFLNLVVVVETRQTLAQLSGWLKQLEDQHGRIRSAARFSARTLDVDILFYGSLTGIHEGIMLPRPEITENAYVLRPLADVAGDLLHPGLNISYARLWEEYNQQRQTLWPIDFQWQGRQLSQADATESHKSPA
jgi:2-amino-4-hydroxy-6-hydroxymethyldihydropteridine diphosphokinase